MKSRIWLIALLVLAVLIGGAAVGAAQESDPPGEPAAFYGTAQDVNGIDAPARTTIVAVVNGSVVDSIEVETPGKFGGSGATDGKLRVDSTAGDEVEFRLEGATGNLGGTADLNPGVFETNLEFDVGLFDDDRDQSGGASPNDDEDDGDEEDEEIAEEPPQEDEDEVDEEDDEEIGEEPVPTVAETPEEIGELVPETIELSEDANATRAEVNNISLDPETNQSRVTFSNESSTRSISFETSVEGSTTVVELDRAPADTGDVPGRSVSVSRIEVPEGAQSSPATIEKSVSRDRIEAVEAELEDLTVTRFDDEAGDWQVLESSMVEETDTKVILEAETPGFSFFAVTAVDEPVAALEAPGEVEVGEEMTFDATDSMDEDTEIIRYDWTVDGEAVEGGETMTQTFETAGERTVEVTVENEAGKTNTTSTEVLVLELEETVTTTERAETTDELTTVPTTEEPTTTEAETPGFTIWAAIVALLGAALLRRD